MPRAGVSFEEVELHAETLLAKGDNPTIEKIRRALGDRGSNSTISKYINEWRSRRGLSGSAAKHLHNSQLGSQESAERIWQNLQDETQLAIAKVKDDARIAIEEAYNQKYQIEKACDSAHLEIQTLHVDLNEQKNKNFNLEAELNNIKKEFEVNFLRLEETENHLQDVKLDKEKQISEILAGKELTIQHLKEQIEALLHSHKKEIHGFTLSLEEKRQMSIMKEATFKEEYSRLEKELKNSEAREQQSQLNIAELKQKAKSDDSQLKLLREDYLKISEELIIKEKLLSSLHTETAESKRLAEDRKREREELQILLRNERQLIGRLEERLSHVKTELELAQQFTGS